MIFKLAGGILLLLSGIKMNEGLDVKTKDADESEGTVLQLAKLKFQKIIVPMAIPVLVGPGSITTMFLFGVGIENWPGLWIVVGNTNSLFGNIAGRAGSNFLD